MGHVVDAVQVLLAVLVVHVLSSGPDDLEGVMAEEHLTGRPGEGGGNRCLSVSVCACTCVCVCVRMFVCACV